jgi:hypothetical protein
LGQQITMRVEEEQLSENGARYSAFSYQPG